MRRLERDRGMALGFLAFSFALAFWQRPGDASSDTKIDLHVSPAALLEKVASVWTPSIDLGAVHGAQYSGYLWPMGPIFALPHELGLEAWAVHRIWLGIVFALSAWGTLKLLDVLIGRPRGIAHLVAAAFYVLNPYTVMFSGRTSVILLGYAAMPWMILIVYHGVRAARARSGWWWAGAFALILTSVGGGINGAVVGWMLVGPLVLLIYEPLIGSVRWRDSGVFLLRMGALGTLASSWWIMPLVVHARYGIDFLQFTEQPRTIWATNSAPEALRLMAYWTSYVGSGFNGPDRAFFTEAGTMLFNPLVVGTSLLLPALAVAGFVWTRSRHYAPFFMMMLLVGMAIEVAGFPEGTPSRDAMEWIYRNVPLVRFMRTTQKAAPLVALGVAGLLGLAAQVAVHHLRSLSSQRWRRVAVVTVPVALLGAILVAALPLTRGTAVEDQLTWKRIPSAWTRAGDELDEDLTQNSRALVLPGQIFAYYTWGGTVDAILPRLTDRPVAVRYETPYGDPHATDLLWTVDRLVQQGRLVPGQLLPLLGLMGTGSVITGSDDDIRRSGAVAPTVAAATLAEQGLGEAGSRTYGNPRSVPEARGDLGPGASLPQVRRHDLPEGRGIVGVAPRGPVTIVDGGAEGLAGLAAFGALPSKRAIFYAGDLSTGELRRHAQRGSDVVVTDSNRRRRFIAEFARQNIGATLRETEPLDENFALIDPFPDRGSESQTVASLEGARYLRSPYEGGLLEFPEHAPIAAFDGDRSTTWVADRYLPPEARWLEVGFERPQDVAYVELEPTRDPFGVEREVDVNGVRARLGPGVTRVATRLRDVDKLRVTITQLDQPRGNVSGGGFKEVRIPGVSIRQRLRPPVIAGHALAGRDLDRVGLTYLFERTTADDPFQRDRQVGSPQLEVASNREDPERQIQRVVFAPAARDYALDAWVHPAVDARDSDLDRLVGLRGDHAFESSGRFHNQPRHRASSAFDTSAASAWIGIWVPPSVPRPWISWRTPEPLSLSTLRLRPARQAVRRPTRVRLSWPGGSSPPLLVGQDGVVALPRPARARRFRLTVLDARFRDGLSERERSTRAVGIGSLRVPGLEPIRPPSGGPLQAECGSVRIRTGTRQGRLRPSGTVADLHAGRPLRARGCDGPLHMGEGIQEISTSAGAFSVDWLRLGSRATVPLPAPVGGGKVVEPGTIRGSAVDGVRVAVEGPSWLVLGQSFSEGWEATCNGRSLGEPRPINGYANGWRAPADCSDVDFEFGPQASVQIGYLISGVVCLALCVLLGFGWRRDRRRGRAQPAEPPPDLPEGPVGDMPPARAAAVALAVTLPLAFLFAARSSVVLWPILTLILWRGMGARTLTGIAAALLVAAVPALYVIYSPRDRGGFNFEYGRDLIWAHWATVAALILLMLACWRVLRATRVAPGGDDG